MNMETMALGTGLMLLGLYNTYFVPADAPIGYINKIVLLSTGAIVIESAHDDKTLIETAENIMNNMISIKGV